MSKRKPTSFGHAPLPADVDLRDIDWEPEWRLSRHAVKKLENFFGYWSKLDAEHSTALAQGDLIKANRAELSLTELELAYAVSMPGPEMHKKIISSHRVKLARLGRQGQELRAARRAKLQAAKRGKF